MVARRYLERYGTDSRALASVPIAFRKHASMNPLAIMREPFDVEEHQRSRYVCEPLHLLDYCLINDGAACVILARDDIVRARQPDRPLVRPLASALDELVYAYDARPLTIVGASPSMRRLVALLGWEKPGEIELVSD